MRSEDLEQNAAKFKKKHKTPQCIMNTTGKWRATNLKLIKGNTSSHSSLSRAELRLLYIVQVKHPANVTGNMKTTKAKPSGLVTVAGYAFWKQPKMSHFSFEYNLTP